MKIVSTNGATVLNVEGVEYLSEGGAFEVPQELGERLVVGPAFERDYIAQDKASAAEKIAQESRDGILKRVEALEAAVFPDRAPTPEPTPDPVVVPSAPEAPVTPEPVVEEPAPADPEPVADPAPETPVEDVPVQSDAAPVDVPPIAEPDAPVDIPVDTVVETPAAESTAGEVTNVDGTPSTDLTPEEAVLPAIVSEVPSEDAAAE